MRKNKTRILTLVLVVLLTAFAFSQSTIVAKEETPSRAEVVVQPEADDARPVLDGATVFAWNCGSCHSERYPKEHTDAEWDVIVTHMRVRANLTGEQADAVLHYLKENNS